MAEAEAAWPTVLFTQQITFSIAEPKIVFGQQTCAGISMHKIKVLVKFKLLLYSSRTTTRRMTMGTRAHDDFISFMILRC